MALIDNDVLFKLGACGLVHDLPRLFKAAPADVVVLPSAGAYFRSALGKERYRQPYTAAGIQSALDFINKASALRDDQIDVEVFGRLVPLPQMDVGEAILLSAATRLGDGYLATGDKRCLEALVGCSSCSDIIDYLEGRVVCLEQIILTCFDLFGFEWTRDHVAPARHCDGWLEIVFSHGSATAEDHAREGLRSAVARLRSNTHPLLRQ